jgi:hypothetical protein
MMWMGCCGHDGCANAGHIIAIRQKATPNASIGFFMCPSPADGGFRFAKPPSQIYLIASGLVGEPTAPVMGIAGATNMNS